MLLSESLQQPADDALVKVIPAEVIVAGRGEDLNRITVDIQDTDIKGAAAQVVDHHLAGLSLVKTVCQGGRGRLVDDPQDVEAGNQPGVLSRLTLRVGKICRDRDYRIGDRFPDIAFRIGLELLQNHGRDFLGCILLAVNAEAGIRSHIALDGRKGPGCVGDSLALGSGPDEALT